MTRQSRYHITQAEIDHLKEQIDKMGMALDLSALHEDVENEKSALRLLTKIENRDQGVERHVVEEDR